MGHFKPEKLIFCCCSVIFVAVVVVFFCLFFYNGFLLDSDVRFEAVVPLSSTHVLALAAYVNMLNFKRLEY